MRKIFLLLIVGALIALGVWFVRRAEKVEAPENGRTADMPAGFNRTGNLLEEDNGWKLLYEEPGKPALSAKLSFDRESVCTDASGSDILCPNGADAPWIHGARARVVGELADGVLLVTKLSLSQN